MKAYIGNTDHGWFNYLESLDPTPEDINFWRPSDTRNFKSADIGSPFFFRLKSPIDKVGGFAYFSQYTNLPISAAWEYFEKGNGHETFEEFEMAIQHYRKKNNKPFEYDPVIGCIILSSPVFFHPSNYLELPQDWPREAVQGKSYDFNDPQIKTLWQNSRRVSNSYSNATRMASDSVVDMENSNRFEIREQKVRIGQGAFRAMVLESYNRQCCVTGERTLPTLEAAHIQEHAKDGPHSTSNGILLRADLHRLYDAGYITITTDLRLKVSPRLRTDFKSGGDYEKLDGKPLLLPVSSKDYPNAAHIKWHHENRYRK